MMAHGTNCDMHHFLNQKRTNWRTFTINRYFLVTQLL